MIRACSLFHRYCYKDVTLRLRSVSDAVLMFVSVTLKPLTGCRRRVLRNLVSRVFQVLSPGANSPTRPGMARQTDELAGNQMPWPGIEASQCVVNQESAPQPSQLPYLPYGNDTSLRCYCCSRPIPILPLFVLFCSRPLPPRAIPSCPDSS
ncbi:hypothetical protein E2C01_017696 [Portunus trituberculatus]|uniref:Uncharacterized protein n=1 Tax=Portunus trituberculatus TaxID=210409 RepID=A0A5B7DT75_PORTR|nr:hypothetical protein [Portunus trituberculatus]